MAVGSTAAEVLRVKRSGGAYGGVTGDVADNGGLWNNLRDIDDDAEEENEEEEEDEEEEDEEDEEEEEE